MPRAEFAVDLPEGIWVGGLSRANPGTTMRVLSAFPDEESGYGLLEITADAIDAVLDGMQEADGVSDVAVVYRTGDRVVVQFGTTELPLLVTIQRAQIPLELPVEITDGTVALEITAPHDRLSAFGDQLDALGISYVLDRVYRSVEEEDPLTDRQADLLRSAIEHGYYDTPRSITLTALAGELDMAPSTVSETLHRAEETVVKTFASERLDVDVETVAAE